VLLTTKPKRAAIYFFYDKDGEVDDYISYQVKDLKENVDFLLFVVNGKLTSVGRKKIAPIADEIFTRENEGFDVWAYRQGMEHISWGTLEKYDELVLMNFTCFGPIRPLAEAFEWAMNQDLDFWGMTKYHKHSSNPRGWLGEDYPYDYIPEHIQSCFLVIRQPLLSSKEHRSYWKTMPPIESYADSIACHESIFTKTFEDKGYSNDVYVNTKDIHTNSYPLMFNALDLVRDRKALLVKRKSFALDYPTIIAETFGEGGQDLIRFLDVHTNYDLNLIWDNVLRDKNMNEIKNSCHLIRILPRNLPTPKEKPTGRYLLVIHLYYEDLIDYCLSYAKNTPASFDIIITIVDERLQAQVEDSIRRLGIANHVSIYVMKNRGRAIASLLIGAATRVSFYDLVFFVHSKKTPQEKPESIGVSWSHKCFENLLATTEYINNIILTFQNEPRLGMAFPPPPYTAHAWSTLLGREWGDNYERTKALLVDFDVTADCNESQPPIAPLGTMFVFRPDALKKLFAGPDNKGWEYAHFPEEPTKNDGTILHAIERAYPFFAQDAGYYVTWLLNDEYARIELDNYYFGWLQSKMTADRIPWLEGELAHHKYVSQAYSNEIEAIKNTLSWRVTKPLRALRSLQRKLSKR
jgi:rhamnosyltransferase